MLLRRLVIPFVLACFVVGFASVALAGQTPIERVKEGTEKLINILSDPDIHDPEKHDAAIHRLQKAAEEYIDFTLTTKYAVGRPWLDMSPEMQTKMTDAFVRLLERTYFRRIPAYSGQKVSYTKELVDGKKAKVFTEIVDGDKKIVVEFRLRLVKNQWMIYDAVAEGVSLVMNYRSQFSEVLKDGTPEDLLKLINERIEKIDREGIEGTSES